MSLYTIRWTCPIDGVRKRRVFGTKSEARQFLELPRVLPLQDVESKCQTTRGVR